MQRLYNAVKFIQIIQKARTLIDILPRSLQWYMEYHV